MKNFKILQSEIKHEGIVFNFRIDKIEYNSGNLGIREVIEHNGGAVVVPITKDGKIIFISQYRYPLDKKIIELPAGKLEKDENPYDCAKRELEEEIGKKSNSITKLGEIATTPGFCTEILHIFLAKDLINGKINREEGEYGMEMFSLTLEQAEEKIITNEIIDSKTISALYMLKINSKK